MKKITKEEPKKNNFMARIIGLIGEDITNCWLANPNCEYENYGRPTISLTKDQKIVKATLDFLIKRKKGPSKDHIYLVEQKNFFAHYKGNLRKIDSATAFSENYKKWSDRKCKSTPAWEIFTELSNKNRDEYTYSIKTKKGESVHTIDKIDGTMLIWYDVSEDKAVKDKFIDDNGFHDVIGLTSMVNDLKRWKDSKFKEIILDREKWIEEILSDFK